MRIAESVSHRIFERTLRLSVFREARLFERHYTLQAWLDVGRYGGLLTETLYVWNVWAFAAGPRA